MTGRLAIGAALCCLLPLTGCSGKPMATMPVIIRQDAPAYLTAETPTPLVGRRDECRSARLRAGSAAGARRVQCGQGGDTGRSREGMMMQPPAPLEGLAYYTQSLLALWPEKAVIGSCVAGAVSLFGGDAYLLWMLGAMLVADFAFGLADAVRRRHFRCRMLAHGALKFPAYCLYLLIVGVVNASLSRSFGGFDMPLLNLFIAYLIITDAVSVIAHMQRLGIPVPDLFAAGASPQQAEGGAAGG